MGDLAQNFITEWGQGVITSMRPDEVPQNAYTKGMNTVLVDVGGSKAVPAQREGFQTLTATYVHASSPIIGLKESVLRSGTDPVKHRLIITDDGGLYDWLDLTGSITTIGTTTFTDGSGNLGYLPSFADAKNQVYIVNGTNKKRFDGTTVYGIGITKPVSAPTIVAGAAGNHTGTYEARVTFYNSATGQESSAGTTSSTVTVTSKQLSWSNIPVSSDAQVTDRRLYIRNTATMTYFYFAATVAGNITTTATTNLLDTSLATIGPDTTENDPPSGDRYFIAYHKNRLFLASETAVAYSKLDMIESFGPLAFETPNPQNGNVITGMISAFDILIIFKSDSMWALIGDDPDTWVLRPIDETTGCVRGRSIIYFEGNLYWWSLQGPNLWSGTGGPTLIGKPLIAPTIGPDGVSTEFNPSGFQAGSLFQVCGAYDFNNSRYIWSVPQPSATRNTLMLPFSGRLQRWESDGWDPFDVSAMGSWTDENSQAILVVGGYKGQIFQYGGVDGDGIPSGTISGTITPVGTSVAIITDSGASFLTTGGKLIERKVTLVDSNGLPMTTVGSRPRITANTSTALTLSASITGLTAGATYTYYVGGPAFDWVSAWMHAGEPFTKKRYQFLYLQTLSEDVTDMLVDVYTDYQTPSDDSTGFTSTVTDIDNDAVEANVMARYRMGCVGQVAAARFRHFVPNEPLTLLKIGTLYENLSEKLG